jgi:hypothetical protein
VAAEFIENMNDDGVLNEFIFSGYFTPCSMNTIFCPGLLLKFRLVDVPGMCSRNFFFYIISSTLA